MFTMIAFILAILTLVLLLVILVLLLVQTTLLALPVRVAALALNCADLIGIMLVRAMVDRVRLKLRHHSIVHFTKVKVSHLTGISDNRDEDLPFLWECGQSNHCLELRRYFDICSLHTSKHIKHLIKVDVGVSSHRDMHTQAVLKVFKD